jgi:hypothetical protein
LLFDHLMMRGVLEYNPAARAKPPRLVREFSHTPVFEQAEIVLSWINPVAFAKGHSRQGDILCPAVPFESAIRQSTIGESHQNPAALLAVHLLRLSWTHFIELIRIDDPLKRTFTK